MRRIWHFATDTRSITIIGLAAMAALFYLGAQVLELALIWALAATGVMLLAAALVWLWRRWHAGRESDQLGEMIGAKTATESPPRDQTVAEVKAIRESLLKAIQTIQGSRMGLVSGRRALYELPWHMIIGNPAAGKSTAIANSGLQFPFADAKIVQGIGGTRNCDWFFTPEGILLDTAGRYSVLDEHRAEWLGFLDLLKKYRRRAPINGILVAVSIAELRGDDPEVVIRLARSLRKRVQDLIERLEVFAPVYVMLTKADLIAGFSEFFAQSERVERERLWGATMPYKRTIISQQLVTFFDQSFDELCDGLRELSLANMSQQRRDSMQPGVFTFPLEFATIRTTLRAFLVALFEDNPFQFKPVFRGYYFTSALQEGMPVSEQSQRVAKRFALSAKDAPVEVGVGQSGFFLLNLFRRVIFADKDLVSQYASKNKVRLTYAAFFVAVVLLGVSLGGWSWSYLGNRQLVANVQADLDKVIKLQVKRLDLQSRLESLEILQDRIEQLESYREERPWSLRMGLYQGDLLERKLREEYFFGVKEVMIKPLVAQLETLLSEMNAHPDALQAPGVQRTEMASPGSAASSVTEASAINVDDGYNALKTYLMLADKSHAEPGHLSDQLSRHWRTWLENNRGTMPREQMIHSAEHLMTFYLAQIADPSWPRIEIKLAMVDQSRDNLRRVVRGMPARERVYADIRARANTRFPAVTVARMVGEQDQSLITGSYAVAGAYTREAWEKFVLPAFREAANHELQSADWVLKNVVRDDLTLDGSPEQIQKALTDAYNLDYAREWKKFIQGVSIANLNGFDSAVLAMNRLGDPQSSPLSKLLNTVYLQTSWDNPALMGNELKEAQSGFVNWVKNSLFRRVPSQVNASTNFNVQVEALRDKPMGAIGREFAGVGKLVAAKDKDASLMRSYMDVLSRLRSRLNQLKNQGDPGPGARQLVQQTLEGSGSELADALRYVDEQMLTGMSEPQKQAIRPILVRPLMQTFSVLIAPVEAEINKTWLAQVYEPFQQSLANKYPFSPNARIEAASTEVAQFFGPEGLIAKFSTIAMGALVMRRGDVLAPRTWADMGIRLAPQTVARFPGWIAPISAGGVTAASASAQTVFQIQPLPASGALEYTVDIDGQQLRYRNTPTQWVSMVHPGPQGVAGARITVVAFDGRSVDVFNEAGQFGLKRMIDAAVKQKRDDGVFELRWANGAFTVAMGLKIISSPESGAGAASPQSQGFRGMTLPETIAGAAP